MLIRGNDYGTIHDYGTLHDYGTIHAKLGNAKYAFHLIPSLFPKFSERNV